MPTHKHSGALPSERETKTAEKSATLESGVLAVENQSLNAMPTLTANGMTKAEALAVAWTGLEALAKMRQANLYHFHKTGRVWVELLAVSITEANGLEVLAEKEDK